MAEALYIGIDLGTTAVKVGLFDASGRALAAASREARLEAPAPGFAEFDAEEYAGLVFDCLREVLAAPGAEPGALQAIGFSSQAQTFVLLDAEGRPLRPAVSWLDVRAGAEARELSRAAGERVNAISSAPKLLWLRRHEPATAARVRRVLLLPDYLIYRLTGRAVSDPVTAGSTAAYDGAHGRWRADILALCGLEAGMMPEVLGPGQRAGGLSPRAAGELGLPEGVLVAVGTNDQSAGALGAGNVVPGCASVTLGTALAVIVTGESEVEVPPGVSVGPHPVPGLHVLLAYAKTAGVVLRWFRDTFAPAESYEDIFREVAGVPVGAEGLSCLPHFSGTATPDFNPAARGAFAGLTLDHGRAHLARALAESLAFTVRENLELLAPAGGVGELRAVGGGARSDVWLQMIADATGLRVERPAVREAACLGAAELAMVAAGRFGGVAEAALEIYAAERRFAPDPAKRAAYDEACRRYRALREALYGARRGGQGQ